MTGGIISGLLVLYGNPEGRQKANDDLIGYIGDQLIFANLDDTQQGYFAIMIPNLAQAKEILRRALAVPGISSGRIDLVEEIDYHYEVYGEQLEKLERSLDHSSRVERS